MLNNQEIINNFSNKWLAFIGIALLSFGCYLDYTVVNVALPTIQKELQTNLTLLQWVMNIYFLALCILATIMGRCGDLFGRRRCFYIGTAIFAIASIIAGLSPNIHWLIFGRLLQGIGAAIVFPLGPSLLPQSFPENERGKAIAWLGSMGGVALALGPVVGGIIVTYWGWRWIFFINVPIILLGYLFCFRSVKESNVEEQNTQLDWQGMLLLAFAMGGIILSLIHSQDSGWADVVTLLYLSIGLVAGIFLIFVERKQDNPLIDLKDFSNVMFYSGAALGFLAGLLSAVALFFDPLYLQIIRNQSPELSGFILFAIPVAVFAVAFLVNGFITRLGIITTILLGLGLGCLAIFSQIFFTPITPLWFVVCSFICLGSMWALGNTVSIIAAQTAVGQERTSVATGTIVTMFNIGGSIGLAIAVVIYHYVTSHSLTRFLKFNRTEIHTQHFSNFQQFISNPAHMLAVSMNAGLRNYFNAVFMRGFINVMCFLLILSSLVFLSVFIFRVVRGKDA